ncbi:GntR family transcriptional regulator, partial [Streptomyces albidoflavus]
MPSAPPVAAAEKKPPAADRVYRHVKQAVLDRSYAGGTLLT